MDAIERQKEFHIELKQLLNKYKAEILIEDFGYDYVSDNKIVVDFEWDESLIEKYETGLTPQLILGRFEDGKPL